MTQKTQKVKQEEKVEKETTFTAIQVANLCGLHSTYRFVVLKKFKSEQPKALFEWAALLIEHRIISNIPDAFRSSLTKQQVEDLTDLLK